MLHEWLSELETSALARIAAAQSMQELEPVRIEFLGRKGSLSQASKELGKAPPEERAQLGKRLNSAKQSVEDALEAKKQQFEAALLDQRLEAEWVDLTLPAPGPRRGHLHPITQIQPEIEELFISLGFAVLDGPEVETEYYNFDALNIPARSSRARHAGHVLARRRESAADPHLAGSGARHGEARAAAAHDRARPRVPQRERGRFARAHVLSARRHDGGSRRLGRAPALLHEDAAHRHLPARSDGAAAARIFSRSSSRVSSSISNA